MRAELVRRPKLAMFARDIDLGQHLYMGKGEEEGGGRDRDGVSMFGVRGCVRGYLS